LWLEGKDASSTTSRSARSGQADHLGADDSLEELVRTMARHEVKRLPVIDGHTLIGMVSEAVLAAIPFS
jgi:predicted transcriptional regulator